jgi:hypothetical protein
VDRGGDEVVQELVLDLPLVAEAQGPRRELQRTCATRGAREDRPDEHPLQQVSPLCSVWPQGRYGTTRTSMVPRCGWTRAG